MLQRQHESVGRSVQTHESKVLEMETQRGVDRRKAAVLEDRLKDQMADRNNLLLALWHRLSTLCGTEWAQQHSLIDGQVPSLEVIAKNLPGFNRNIIYAVKTVEGIIGGFRGRIRNIEKDLWKDFQTLEHTLDVRVKRLDQLERSMDGSLSPDKERKPGRRSVSRTSSRSNDGSDFNRLKSENKLLKAELNYHRQVNSPLPSTRAPSIAESARVESMSMRSPSRPMSVDGHQVPPHMIRGYTTSAVETLQHQNQQHNMYNHAQALDTIPDSEKDLEPPRPVTAQHDGGNDSASPSPSVPGTRHGRRASAITQAPLQPSEARWIHRLKELERRLKAEREARLLDRSGARKRLQEGQAENEELRGRLQREKVLRQNSVD